jgi:UDP-N-acetylglucosamine/UDP-N-acetylgalactosamine diphosphorylase
VSYDQGVYKSIDRIVRNGLIYIGNIRALKAWYENVRVLFIRDRFDRAVFEGALENLDLILTERINRLEQLAGRMEYSFQTLEKTDGDSPQVGKKQREFSKGWKTMREQLETPLNTVADAGLMNEIGKAPRTDYITAVRNLSEGARRGAAAWLQSVVDEAAALWN